MSSEEEEEGEAIEDERVPMASEQIQADWLLISSCVCEVVAVA